MKGRQTTLANDLVEEEEKTISSFIEERRDEGLFILTMGEIDDYLPEGVNDVNAIIEFIGGEGRYVSKPPFLIRRGR